MPVIPAAGTLPWRRRGGQLQVAMVHRPKYDDWSWPKGKLDPGEEWAVAAVRETLEETALPVRLGRPLPAAAYTVLDRAGLPDTKEVRYWAAECSGPAGRLANEVDEVAWVPVTEAHTRLDYARDREQLRALQRADASGTLTTWPLTLVRHAHARSRSSWRHDDPDRPLDRPGLDRARALSPLLAAYGTTRLVSSPSVRCADTLRPYAADAGLPVRLKSGLSEEGYAEDPTRAPHHLRRLLERGEAAALCTHGPVLPDLLAAVASLPAAPLGEDDQPSRPVGEVVEELLDAGLAKGEAVVLHLLDRGEAVSLTAIERHRPTD